MKNDAITTGSGRSGNPLAYRLADAGWQVALIEKGNLGGTCIKKGCTPAKTLLKDAVYIHPTLTEGLFTLLECVKPVG